MNAVKSYRVIAAALTMLLFVTGIAAADSGLSLPFFRQKEEDTVTITRDEYESMLKYQKLELLLQLLDQYYYDELDYEALMDGAAKGLMEGVGDMYTFYYNEEEMAELIEEETGEYAGIGCQLIADPESERITVTRVFKGSPAEKVGMRAGDQIVYVNEEFYSAYEMDDAVDVMRGTPGESVRVTVMRGLEAMDFEVVREVVEINYAEYRIMDGNVGYLIVYDFMGDAYDIFAEAIEAFKTAGVKAMVLDLRNNGGGLVDLCVSMADLILPEGVVVSMKDKMGEEYEYMLDAEYYDVPMVVLVNEFSASASEILSGAIRDYDAGLLVGTKTFGKGVVQNVIEFTDGTGAQFTTSRYYTPSGECIHGIGIEPDVMVELDEDAVTLYGINNLPYEEDAQLQKAIELIESGEVK